MRLIKKQKKELIRQTLLLKEALIDAIERIDGHQLTYEVCGLLGHPLKDTGFCYCQQVFAATSGSPVYIEGLVVVPKKECEASPDGKHCWHRMMSNVVIPGKNVLDEVCCFCGAGKQTEVQLPASYSYSYDASKHGRYAPVYQVLY